MLVKVYTMKNVITCQLAVNLLRTSPDLENHQISEVFCIGLNRSSSIPSKDGLPLNIVDSFIYTAWWNNRDDLVASAVTLTCMRYLKPLFMAIMPSNPNGIWTILEIRNRRIQTAGLAFYSEPSLWKILEDTTCYQPNRMNTVALFPDVFTHLGSLQR